MHYKALILCVLVVIVLMSGMYFLITPKLETQTSINDEGGIERVGMGGIEGQQTSPAQADMAENPRTNEMVEAASTTQSLDAPEAAPVLTKETQEPAPSPAPSTSTPEPLYYMAATVAMHASASSCWSIIRLNVYDLTDFISKHPGGEKKILKICGTDGTALFESQHGGDTKPESTLSGYRIGTYTP